MALARISPGERGFEERMFECATCGRTDKIAVAVDPMKTDAMGWLAGELSQCDDGSARPSSRVRAIPDGGKPMWEASLPDPKPRRSVSSAGILIYRHAGSSLEVLLVHPGGPYWRKKDEGAWSVPKGEMYEGEKAEVAARREFLEETGVPLSGLLDPLGEIRQRGGKRVIAFAVEGMSTSRP
jgi:hypothetical protein